MGTSLGGFDHLGVDGHLLRLFVTVYEEGSVSAAARRLDMAQSAVSHALNRLRRLVGDPLFVKSGRRIVATQHAERLVPQARLLMDGLKALTAGHGFDPTQGRLSWTVAANDFQRDLLLPRFYARVAGQLADFRLQVVPAGRPTNEMLREARCDLLISPTPPEGLDIIQKRLFDDRYVCVFDGARRAAPASAAAFLAGRHLTVVHPSADPLNFDKALEGLGIHRDVVVSVANFSGLAPFLRGTDLLACIPGRLHALELADFQTAPLPLDLLAAAPPGTDVLRMYMAWHLRGQHDPAQAWLRGQLEVVAREMEDGV
ncbi:LysR family transcriptional regulator [Nitrospirillum sp. BR 11163]|uniref:LysR family transcriptional regulator n=1 Tax=Nitrospirillum sp. BR 11163 TaxID=3104323 RepID=UPI002AFEDB88|nr:LysR family transcriptional regulator [Nitrospirillum sp. BR 11163]MEA1672141.1 LysR family transcriptional regulator [Nitrospirillum sp. BR 11163]